jgi:hypothetical protein
LIEPETEVVNESKIQITSTKFQINLKTQNTMTETHFPRSKRNRDLGSTIQQRNVVLNFQQHKINADLRNSAAKRPFMVNNFLSGFNRLNI